MVGPLDVKLTSRTYVAEVGQKATEYNSKDIFTKAHVSAFSVGVFCICPNMEEGDTQFIQLKLKDILNQNCTS